MKRVAQSDLFDVEAITAENKRLIAEKEKANRDRFYSNVELPYFEAPKNDSEKLFNLQFRYLKNGDKAARQELYLLSYEIMRRLLWRRMKKGGLGWLDEEKQNEIVSDAFLYVFRRYEKGEGYAVTKSFISVLKSGIRHAVDYTTMKDSETSLNGIKNITQKAVNIFR